MTEALDRARNTVVAALDGSAGDPEGDFLAAAYRLRGNLSAYDPAMVINTVNAMLAGWQIPPGAVTLTPGSVTGFGHRVPQTELLIPHPGPWARNAGPGGLAACIEAVLGAQSTGPWPTACRPPTPPPPSSPATRLSPGSSPFRWSRLPWCRATYCASPAWAGHACRSATTRRTGWSRYAARSRPHRPGLRQCAGCSPAGVRPGGTEPAGPGRPALGGRRIPWCRMGHLPVCWLRARQGPPYGGRRGDVPCWGVRAATPQP